MSEITPLPGSLSPSDSISSKLDDFLSQYGNPDRGFTEQYEEQQVDYSTLHLLGRTADHIIVLRSGIHETEGPNAQKIRQVFWLGVFNLTTNAPATYEITDSERQIIDPFQKSVGGYEIVHTAKSHDSGEIVQLRMGSRALEWTSHEELAFNNENLGVF